MIYSICIKTNNNAIINYLLKNLEAIPLFPIYLSSYKFKKYKNVIVHYIGNYPKIFHFEIAKVLSNCTIEKFESKLIKNIINCNYFYFSEFEREKILNICFSIIDEPEYTNKIEILQEAYFKYLTSSKTLVLDGFIKFRAKEYIKLLDELVDTSVNKFIVEREYEEFIDLLRMYISSKSSSNNLVHLIYSNGESILLDENSNIIDTNDSAFAAKYLSDITFSSNDYCLNTLLNILPEKIHIHLIDNEDEFINTLKLIFENRIIICKDCNICKTYRLLNTSHK